MKALKVSRIETIDTCSVIKGFVLKCVLLEELEGLDSPSTVREQKTEILLSNSIPGHAKRQTITAKEHEAKAIATLTECSWTGMC